MKAFTSILSILFFVSTGLLAARPAFAQKSQQTEIEGLIEKGKAYHRLQNYQEALQTWGKAVELDPLNKEASSLIKEALIEDFNQGLKGGKTLKPARLPHATAVPLEAVKPARASAHFMEIETLPLPAPAPRSLAVDKGAYLKDAARKLDAEVQSEQRSQVRLLNEAQNRQAILDLAFQNGKTFYEEGHPQEALREWKTLLPYVDDGGELKLLLADIEQNLEAIAVVKKSARRAAPASEVRAEESLKAYLERSSNALKKNVEAVHAAREKSEAAASEKKAQTDALFENGRALYEQGRVAEALEEWKKLLPYLSDRARIEALMDEVGAAALVKKSAQRAAPASEVRAEESLKGYLERSSNALKKNVEAVHAAREKSEATASEKKAQTDALFENGRALYEQGRVAEALEEWKKLLPYMTDRARIETLIDEVGAAAVVKKSAQRPAPVSEVRAEQSLKAFLESLSRQLKKNADAARAAQDQSEAAVSEKKAQTDALFENGRALYEQGRVVEALEEWKKLLPYLSDRARIEALMDEAGAAAKSADSASNDSRAAAKRAAFKFESENSLAVLLSAAAEKKRSESGRLERVRQDVQASADKRRALVDTAFKKGKALYDQGKPDEALKEWELMLPEFQDPAGVQALMKEFDQANRAALEASAQAQKTQSLTHQKLGTPEGMALLLKEEGQRLKAETAIVGAANVAAQAQIKERQGLLDANFRKGKSLYAKGKVNEALEVWRSLLPRLEEADALNKLLLDVEQKHERLVNDQKLYERSLAAQPEKEKLKAPEGFRRTLEETDRALAGSIIERQGQAQKKLKTKNLDEIEQMMLEYNVMDLEEIEKTRIEQKALQKALREKE